MNHHRVKDLLLRALETEICGQELYGLALHCAANGKLKEDWDRYLAETCRHEAILRDLLAMLDIDAEEETLGRRIARQQGESLAMAMEMALDARNAETAQLVAAECVVLAETADQHHWKLIGTLARKAIGQQHRALQRAHALVEQEEDTHLLLSRGWRRELWLDALGLRAVLPPPEVRL